MDIRAAEHDLSVAQAMLASVHASLAELRASHAAGLTPGECTGDAVALVPFVEQASARACAAAQGASTFAAGYGHCAAAGVHIAAATDAAARACALSARCTDAEQAGDAFGTTTQAGASTASCLDLIWLACVDAQVAAASTAIAQAQAAATVCLGGAPRGPQSTGGLTVALGGRRAGTALASLLPHAWRGDAVSTLGDAAGTASAVNAAAQSLPPGAQAQWNDAYGRAQATINSQGAQAAGDLLACLKQTSCDTTSSAFHQQAIAAMAAVVSAAASPAIGAAYAAFAETLEFVGRDVLMPILDALGLGGGSTCTSSGSWTPLQVLTDSWASALVPPVPVPEPGSFAQFAAYMLATNIAGAMNCGAYVPDAPGFDLVGAIVSVWNDNHDGPAADVFWPNALTSVPYGGGMHGELGRSDSQGQALVALGDSIFASTAGASNLPSSDAVYAWQPLSAVPSWQANFGRVVSVHQGPVKRRLNLGGGAVLQETPPPAASSPATSTAAKVAIGTAVVAGGLGAAWLALGRPLTLAALRAALGV